MREADLLEKQVCKASVKLHYHILALILYEVNIRNIYYNTNAYNYNIMHTKSWNLFSGIMQFPGEKKKSLNSWYPFFTPQIQL